MLEFKTPQIEDGDWVNECFKTVKSMNCEYTFGNLYLWSAAYRTKIARFNNFLICRWGKDDDIAYSVPIGTGDFREAVLAVIEDANSIGVKPHFAGITEYYKGLLDEYFPNEFVFSHDDGDNDYIYNVSDLANLSGKKYHGKRNHISNFKRNNPDWTYEEITEENISECIELHSNWIYDKDENEADYSFEFEAVLNGFENYKTLGMLGGIIKVESKAIAYTYGEPLNESCFVTHFEKAPADIQGAYAIINQEFAKRLLEKGYEYVNREEDLGLEGLRKAKQSYRPVLWLNKDNAVYEGKND